MSLRTPLIATALSSIALIVAAAPAAAQEQRSVEVEYQDLDLTHPNGKARLHNRVKKAARSVCSPAPTRAIFDRLDYKQCVDIAINGSRKAVVTMLAEAGNPTVLASANRKLVITN